MKQRLYPTKPNKNPFEAPVKNNPFSQYLHPSTSPTAPSTSAATFSTSLPTIESTQSADGTNGRFKIRPGDISTNKADGAPQGPIFGISPSGQPFILQPTAPSFSASPSPSAYPYGPSPSPSGFGPTASPTGFGPSASPTGFGPSASPTGFSNTGSYIGPSPSSYPYIQQQSANPSPSVPFLGVKVNPTQGMDMSTIPPGTKDERLMFLPVDNNGKQVAPAPTIQTKNGQNQTVVFTTMNNLPDLMAQLSGTKTEVRMIDDMKTWQATLARVQATQATSTLSPPTSETTTTNSQQSTTPTPTDSGNRRMDGELDIQPMTWRPNGTIPTPTLESIRKRFPTGLGANVLHAVSAGFSANQIKEQKWAQNNVNGMLGGNIQPQVIYTMANGVPVAINTGMPVGNYQPYLIQGTKEPVMAYYGYNWNTAPQQQQQIHQIISTQKPIDIIEPAQLPADPKYTSRFRGTAPSESGSEVTPTKGPVFKVRKHKPTTTTRDPIDPLSEEYDDVAEEATPFKVADKHLKKNKPQRKGQSNEYEETSKTSRRRRPGVLRDEDNNKEVEEENSSEEETRKNNSKKVKPTTATTSTTTTDSVVPDVLSRRIDESDEEFESQDKKSLKVHKDMFMVSGERETTLKQSQEIQPTAKLPILLAPSIISSKSVVKKTGSSYSENGELKTPPKPTSTIEPSSSTSKLLTTILSKLSTTSTTKVTPTVSQTSTSKASKDEDDDFRETQAELKSLLKKIQEKLSSKGDAYDLGDDAIYDYYEELQVPSTKATTTTTTNGTKKPKTKHSKSKPKSKKSKKNKKSKKKSKKSKSKKSTKKTTKKPKTTTTTTTTTTKQTTTTTEPIATSPTFITPEVTIASTKLPQILNHHRHPVSSIESFTSTASTTTTTTEKSIPNPTSTEATGGSSSIEPQQYQHQPQVQTGSVETPTNSPAVQDASTVSFVYPQSARQHLKDTTAARIHHRRRPLWMRRKGASGSTESLEPLAQPSATLNQNGKVIRLVRRRRPIRRRPVFVQQSIEVDQTPSSATAIQEESTTPQSTSTTSFPSIDSLFENNNELNKRVGYPDSTEGSQRNVSQRIGGKRKLKLIRLKGQRAQWRLKMNEQDSSAGDEVEPQAALLVSPPSAVNSQPSPLASPLAVTANAETSSDNERQSREGPSVNSNSVEAKVCIQGKCGMISKQ